MTATPDLEPDDTPHAAALAYAAAGLRVLPIKPGLKSPPMNGWQNAATTDLNIIGNWWTQLYRDHGVGIATGPGSDIFVLDVDITGNKAGDETLAELEATHGHLPATATVITASGGTHHYFRLPPDTDIRNSSATRLGPGLDIRGRGGQVVAPPTRIGDNTYQWDGGEMGQIADAPAWLINLLTAEPEHPQPPRTPAPDEDSIAARYNAGTTWTELLINDGWTLAQTTSNGEQRWTRPGKDTRDGISATVGHQGRDCLMVFTDGVPGLNQEQAYSRFGYTAAVHHHGDRSGFARQLAEAERNALWTGEILPWVPRNAVDTPAPTDRLELAHLVDWSRFWDQDHSDEEWLAYPLIPKGRAIALYAPAKAGKSTIVLAVAAAAATGRPVLGHRRHDPVRVLYLDYEMTEADLYERLSELGYGPGDDLSNLHYALLPSLPPLDTRDGAVALLALADKTAAELVVVDTFGRAVGGEEDAADTVRDFYRHCGLALKAKGVTYLRTDHSGKDVAKGQRGSSAKNDDVDLVWRLTRTNTKDGDGTRLERTHSRVAWGPAEVKIRRVETDSGYDYLYDTDDRIYPDGTAQAMALLIDHNLIDLSQRKAWDAVKELGLEIPIRLLKAARAMHAEQTIRLDEYRPNRDASRSDTERRGPRRQNSVAGDLESVAGVAPSNPLASESVAVDTPTVAPPASPSVAVRVFRRPVPSRTTPAEDPNPDQPTPPARPRLL